MCVCACAFQQEVLRCTRVTGCMFAFGGVEVKTRDQWSSFRKQERKKEN